MSESSLPKGCMIAVLNRLQAAEYIGVSPTVFDGMVDDGRMPKAVVLSERRFGHLTEEVNAALRKLPRKGDDPPDLGAQDERMSEGERTQLEKFDAARKARKA